MDNLQFSVASAIVHKNEPTRSSSVCVSLLHVSSAKPDELVPASEHVVRNGCRCTSTKASYLAARFLYKLSVLRIGDDVS